MSDVFGWYKRRENLARKNSTRILPQMVRRRNAPEIPFLTTAWDTFRLAAVGIMVAMAGMPCRASAGATELRVKIDMEQVHTRLDHRKFGVDRIWYKASWDGSWDWSHHRPREEFIQMLREYRVGAIRFPSGLEANMYRWKRAIGPLQQRVDQVSGYTGHPVNNVFGPDEWGQLTGRLGMGSSLVVAWAFDSVEDAADLVEYMNAPNDGTNPGGGTDWAAVRANNGHPEPYGIVHWEIGNEVHGGWGNTTLHYPASGDEYEEEGFIKLTRSRPFDANEQAHAYVHGFSRRFEHQHAVRKDSWIKEDVQSKGQPGEEYYVKFPPVSLAAPVRIRVGDQVYTFVSDFSNSTPTDRHVRLDPVSGCLRFGDGQRGMIPPVGSFVSVSYTSGPHGGFMAYDRAMKNIDPAIRVLSSWEHDSFFREMAEANQGRGAPFDGFIVHYYPEGEHHPDWLLMRSMANGIQFRWRVSKYLDDLKKFPNPSLQGKVPPIHLSEFELTRWIRPTDDDPLDFSKGTLMNSMANVLLYHDILYQFNDLTTAVYPHALFKWFFEDGLKVTSRAKAHRMVMQHDPELLKVEMDVPTMNEYGHHIPKVSISASRGVDAEGNPRLTLVLLNTTRDEHFDLVLDLPHFPGSVSDARIQRRVLQPAEGSADPFLCKDLEEILEELPPVQDTLRIPLPPARITQYRLTADRNAPKSIEGK